MTKKKKPFQQALSSSDNDLLIIIKMPELTSAYTYIKTKQNQQLH